MVSCIVGGIVLAAFVSALYFSLKNKGKCSGCNGDCSSCRGHGKDK